MFYKYDTSTTQHPVRRDANGTIMLLPYLCTINNKSEFTSSEVYNKLLRGPVRMKSALAGPAATDTTSDTIFGWQVSLRKLTLEAIAWKSVRTLHLIRKRQARSAMNSSPSMFDFAGLPLELFDKIVNSVRHDAIRIATSEPPFKTP